MSTTSHVGIAVGNTVTYIYVHFDGYLDGVGKTLLSDFNDEAAVAALIAEGDHSSIISGDVVSYKSRGEEAINRKCTLDKYKRVTGRDLHYGYLFINGKWKYFNQSNGRWMPLTEKVCKG